jgi:protein-L-isoaspartate(D-aspartate) O-methyltransferase
MTLAERDAIERMVQTQIEARGIADPRVLGAFARVNRFRFVPSEFREFACSDQPLPLIAGQTISQPYIVAKMTELLELSTQSRVLEIGTGSGYQTAILAELSGSVYSIEIVEKLHALARSNLSDLNYDNVHLILGNGYEGHPDAAPYDAIIVTAAPLTVPGKLVAQLAIGGKLVVPVGGINQMLCRLTKVDANRVIQEALIPVAFVPMVENPR